jgi:hypothetical protein
MLGILKRIFLFFSSADKKKKIIIKNLNISGNAGPVNIVAGNINIKYNIISL